MKLPPLLFALLVAIQPCPASLYMTGTLHNSAVGWASGADGTFFFSLNGTTLTYSVSTGLLSTSGFDLPSAGFSLQSGAVDIPLPLLGHKVVGFSGCSLTFAAYSPLSVRYPDSNFVFFPLGIADPGECRSYFQMSVLHGSVEVSQAQISLFDRPDFGVSISSLGIAGQTDPEVTTIPEPGTFVFLGLLTLGFGRRRRPIRANKGAAGKPPGSPLSAMTHRNSNPRLAFRALSRPEAASA